MNRIISALIALTMLLSCSSVFSTQIETDAESGFKFKSTLTETETEPEITLHDTVTSHYFTLPSPSIYSDYTEKERAIVNDADIYVAPDGNDNTGDGSFDKPYATLERARNAANELKNSGAVFDGITVAFKAGVYQTLSQVRFTSSDSGSEECPILYTAYGDGEVLFKGSVTLNADDFTTVAEAEGDRLSDEAKSKVRVMDLKKYGITSSMLKLNQTGTASMRGTNVEISINRELYTLAQYPNRTDRLLQTRGLVSKSPAKYLISDGDMDRVKSWGETNDIWGVGMMNNEWNEVTSPLTVNSSKNTITWSKASSTGGQQIHYFFFNIFEELDDPGEWYLDRENCLMYIYPNSDLEGAAVELTLDMQNDFISLQDCDYISFDGLSFMGTRGNGITGSNCDHVTVNDCYFHAIMGTAVSFTNSYYCTVSDCEIAYVGRKGIVIGGGVKATLKEAHNLVDNNLITHWALYTRTFTPAIDASGQGNTVSHNELAYSTATAVLMGGNLNYFEYNMVHDCVTLASDCSAFYNGSSWTSGANILRYNMFYNIGTDQKGPAAIYWDDGMAYQSAYGNLIVNVGGHGFSIGGGFGQTVVNNIIVNTRGCACLYDSRPYIGNRSGDSFYALGNGFIWNLYKSTPYTSTVWRENFPLLAQVLQDETDKYAAHFGFNPAFSLMCDNVYLNNGKKLGGYGCGPVHYSAVVDNYLEELTTLDDVFVDYRKGDYRLKEDSAAFSAVRDFEEIPYHLIGRY